MTSPTDPRQLPRVVPASREERLERWGDGPWLDEPDREEWREAGLACLVRRIPHGSLCGYVAVPPGHPLHGVDHGEIEDVTTHGGLTYSSTCDGEVCHVPEPGESDNVWWFGFDTGHAFDYVPALWHDQDHPFAVKVRSEIDAPSDEPFVMRYRDFAYVRARTAKLARDLAERAQPIFVGIDHAALRAGARPRNSAEAYYLLQQLRDAEEQPERDRAADDER